MYSLRALVSLQKAAQTAIFRESASRGLKLASIRASSASAGSGPALANAASMVVSYSSAICLRVSTSSASFEVKWKLTEPAVMPAMAATLASVVRDRP